MADKDQGSKTELPTEKKLKEARKKGDVAKAAEVSLTFGFIFAILLIWLMVPYTWEGFVTLFEIAVASPTQPFTTTLATLGQTGLRVFIGVSVLIVVPLALVSVVVEFLVVGPVLTAEKFKPKMSNLNPAEGLKKMFGVDNLVELIKSVAKTAILVICFYATIRLLGSELLLLPMSDEEHILSAMWYLGVRIFGYTSAAFLLVMFFDTIYQKQAFIKKMKMSIRDIRDELKESEGDPLVKGARRDIGQEWSQAPPSEAAAQANVLVVNPTHVAIAIVYNRETTKIPLVTGKGVDDVAMDMRRAAAHAGVPVLRNEQLARALLADRTEGNYVPKSLFTIIAEVIVWAQAVKERGSELSDRSAPDQLQAPGEDMTNYQYLR
jgi:flagellar biosynthesis protein FlhB